MQQRVLSLLLLGLICVLATASAEEKVESLGEDLPKMSEENVRNKYAVDTLREATKEFRIQPGDVLSLFRRMGYDIVHSPDSTSGAHPLIFYAVASYTVVGHPKGPTKPSIAIIVLPESVSITFREKLSALSHATQKNRLLQGCNQWNYKHRIGACYVDDEGFVNLGYEVAVVQARTPDFNLAFVEQAARYFKISLQHFVPYLHALSPSSDEL